MISLGEKTLDCSMCDLKFTSKGILQAHMNTHLKRTPYKCPYCDKSFANQGSKYNHINTHHFKEDRDLKNCQHCDFRATVYHTLSFHMSNVHFDENIPKTENK